MKTTLTIIILTYNESVHIERAIKSVSGWADKIIVLDSYSKDDTVEKAKNLHAEVIFRKFDNYKNQREYAIEYVKDKTEWLLFLDADEYLTEELKSEIIQAIKDKNVNGFYLARRFIFMNKWIKWGGYYPIYLLRLFRPEHAYLYRTINEHVIIVGDKKYLQHDLIHHDLKSISDWIDKHNLYANYEAKELLDFRMNKENVLQVKFGSTQSERKNWIRYKIWNKLPTSFMPFCYFTYRYFFKLGFLDGKAGFIFHFLQCFWFWLLIDVKFSEMKNSDKK